MKILFLDDDPKRHTEFRQMCQAAGVSEVALFDRACAYSIQEAIAALEDTRFDWAFLDHDLDGQVMVQPGDHTGLAVAEHIARMSPEQRPGRVVIHTMNPQGERAMLAALYGARFRRVQAAYFGGSEFGALVAEMARETS